MGYRAHFASEYKVTWSNTSDFNFLRGEFQDYLIDNMIEFTTDNESDPRLSLEKESVIEFLEMNKQFINEEDSESNVVNGISNKGMYMYLTKALENCEPELETIEIYWF